jgi:PTS system N-acetylgalactosamine-specific IIA component
MTSDGAPPGAEPPAAVPPVAIVAAHGQLAAGLVSAVAQITGRGELLVPLSNAGCSPADIERHLRDAAAEPSVRAVFTDLPAGSCTIAARRLLRDRPDLLLVTGVNLPALVDFVCRVASDASAEGVRPALDTAVERGRTALGVVAAPPPAPTTSDRAPAAAPPVATAPGASHAG